MPDKKLTDNEIIKALKESLEIMLCEGDLQRSATISKSLDLINSLQAENEKNENIIRLADKTIETANAEIERLKEEKTKFENKIDEIYPLVMQLPNAMQQAKSEAYKEFAERLKRFIIPQKADGYTREIILKSDIDNLVKEMVGENDD